MRINAGSVYKEKVKRQNEKVRKEAWPRLMRETLRAQFLPCLCAYLCELYASVLSALKITLHNAFLEPVLILLPGVVRDGCQEY